MYGRMCIRVAAALLTGFTLIWGSASGGCSADPSGNSNGVELSCEPERAQRPSATLPSLSDDEPFTNSPPHMW